MSESDTGQNEVYAGLADAVDWRAARTWRVFGLFAVGLGATSGVIIVATEVVSAMLIAPEVVKFNLVALMISLAFHCGVFYLLDWMVPLRNTDGAVSREQRIPRGPPEGVLEGFLPLIAWTGAVSSIAVLVVLGQPFFELSGSVGIHSWLPVMLAMAGAQFPARALLAMLRNSEDPTGHE